MDSKNITGVELLKHINFDEDFDSACSKINDYGEIDISERKRHIIVKNVNVFGVPAKMIIYFDNQKLSYIDFKIDLLKTASLKNIILSSRDELWEFICKLVDDTYHKLKEKYQSLDIAKNEHAFRIKCEDYILGMGGDIRDKDSCLASIEKAKK